MENTLHGSVVTESILQGKASMGEVMIYPTYKGEYEVIPRADPQTLETADLVMNADVEIAGIPYAEVSNESNGKTVTIG